MLVLLSPAKSINADVEDTTVSLSTPGFDTDTAELLDILRSYSKAVLQQTLGVSPALARQAAQRPVSKCNFNTNILMSLQPKPYTLSVLVSARLQGSWLCV